MSMQTFMYACVAAGVAGAIAGAIWGYFEHRHKDEYKHGLAE